MMKPLPLQEFIAWQSLSKLLQALWPLQLLPPRQATSTGGLLEADSSARTGFAMNAIATALPNIAPLGLARIVILIFAQCSILRHSSSFLTCTVVCLYEEDWRTYRRHRTRPAAPD